MPEHAKGKPLEVWFQDEACVVRQRSRTNNFNHQKRLDKGRLLGRLVLKPFLLALMPFAKVAFVGPTKTVLVAHIFVRGFNLPAQQAVDAVRIADLGS
jgi:hypothetical protein